MRCGPAYAGMGYGPGFGAYGSHRDWRRYRRHMRRWHRPSIFWPFLIGGILMAKVGWWIGAIVVSVGIVRLLRWMFDAGPHWDDPPANGQSKDGTGPGAPGAGPSGAPSSSRPAGPSLREEALAPLRAYVDLLRQRRADPSLIAEIEREVERLAALEPEAEAVDKLRAFRDSLPHLGQTETRGDASRETWDHLRRRVEGELEILRVSRREVEEL